MANDQRLMANDYNPSFEDKETKIETDSRMRSGRAARLDRRPGGPGRSPARGTEAGARRRSRVAADSPSVARRASTLARDQVRAHGRLYDRLFGAALTAAPPLRRRAYFRGLVFFVRNRACAGGVDREALRQAGPAQLPQRRGGGPSAPLAALDEADLSPGGSGGRAVALSRRSLRAIRDRGRGCEQHCAARTFRLSRAPSAAAHAALEPQPGEPLQRRRHASRFRHDRTACARRATDRGGGWLRTRAAASDGDEVRDKTGRIRRRRAAGPNAGALRPG